MADFTSQTYATEPDFLVARSSVFAEYSIPITPSDPSLFCCITLDSTLLAEHASAPAPALAERAVDLANPFMPRDAGAQNAPLGTLQVDATGDWANDSGRTNLRKRIFRRATSMPDSFFHLQDYGFAEGIKRTITNDVLRRLQSRATTQIRLEPDVVSVTVRARALSQNPAIVRLDIKVRDTHGEDVDVTADVRLRS